MKCEATNDPIIWSFPILIGAHTQTKASARSWPNPLRGEWYSFNYNICTWCSSRHYGLECHVPMLRNRSHVKMLYLYCKRGTCIHIHMISDHILRLCISFEYHGFKSSEWLPFLIKANFSIGILISGVINWYMQNSDKNLQLQLIQLIVWKYILLSTYILPLLCLHTSINKQLLWLAWIMQERTMDRTVCQRSYEPLSEWSTCVWRLSVSSHWDNWDSHRTTFTIS